MKAGVDRSTSDPNLPISAPSSLTLTLAKFNPHFSQLHYFISSEFDYTGNREHIQWILLLRSALLMD
ncbi:hypothetical protein K7X08_033726 [Anisodus acutangulus]|uniref:Uncharacterized protein n=1 Tax=Anisodus acutangulus TaxID=402998 RepID=A0A9Q1RCA7_9SOLA|nr:hypothetical protein K7X08_033726 [Anisodus acutangulus]